MAFTSDGKTLACGSADGVVKLWDVPTGQERATLKGNTLPVSSVAFTPDGKTFAILGILTARSQALGRDYETGICHLLKRHVILRPVKTRDLSRDSVAFTSDGKTLASGSWDKTVKLWDVAAGLERATLEGHTDSVLSVAFTSDGKTLAVGGEDVRTAAGEVEAVGREYGPGIMRHRSRDIPTMSYPWRSRLTGSDPGFRELGQHRARLWDVSTGQQRATLEGHTGGAHIIGVHTDDGKTLASGSGDRASVRGRDDHAMGGRVSGKRRINRQASQSPRARKPRAGANDAPESEPGAGASQYGCTVVNPAMTP